MDIIIIVLAFTVLALASAHWGINSADGIKSTEWQRRQSWHGFH